MCAVPAGAAGTAAADRGGYGDSVSDAVAFGDGSMGCGASAVFAVDGGVSLAEASHLFKFGVAVFADIFVNRHNSSQE